MADKRVGVAVILSAYDRMSRVVNSAVGNADRKLAALQRRSSRLADSSERTGRQLIAGGLAIGAPIYGAVQAATEFETKMIDIRKQISALDDPKEMRKMTAEILGMGRELPVAISDIQDLIAAGARMNVPRAELAGYTRDVVKMSIAFDLAAGQLGEDMGKLSKIFNIPIKQVGAFADSINYLDDNAISKGGDIIDVLQRIGGVAKYLKPEQAAALGSTMLTLGETSERASTGINDLVTTLSAADAMSAKTKAAFHTLGLSTAAVQKGMTVDAQGTILTVLDRINKLAPEKQTSALKDLFGMENIGKIAKLSNNVGEYRRQLALLNGQQAGSMDKEYQKRIGSTSSQFQLAKNQLRATAITIGASVLPQVNRLLQRLAPVIARVTQWIDKNPKLVGQLVKGAAVMAGLSLAGGYLSLTVGGLAKGFSLLTGAGRGVFGVIKFLAAPKMKLLRIMVQMRGVLGTVGAAFGTVGKAVMAVSRVLMANPIILIIAAIAAAAYLIYKNWDKIKAWFTRMWTAVKATFARFSNWVKGVFISMVTKPTVMIVSAWNTLKSFFSGMWNGVKNTFMGFWDWLTGWVNKFLTAGGKIVDNIKEGIKRKWDAFKGWFKEKIQGIRDFLPFSPAKTGPLRDIHRLKLVETIAATIKPGPLVSAMDRTLGTLAARSGASALAPMRGGGGGGMTIHYNPTITVSGSATQADADRISQTAQRDFEKMLRQYEARRTRLSFG